VKRAAVAPTPASLDPLPPLAEARLTPPPVREGVVPRTEVIHRLRRTTRSTVALIVAPAGYGKTTVLAALARQTGDRPFVWITVDDGDNDPAVFVRWIAVALERSGAIEGVVPRARRATADSHAVLLARLVRALKKAGPLAIALDDLHRLTSARSMKVVETLANNLPAQSQLLLAGRTQPRLPLTRLRADGKLVVLGTDDLRLPDEEALELLRGAGIDTTAEEAARLIERAEGWPSGLYLASVAIASGDQAIETFDGSHRFVSDYFAAEYLQALDDDDRVLLTRVAPLEELSGPFCDAVLGTSGSTARLERIARSNLFVIGLSAGRHRVFRFHPMFRDALLAELRRREPGRAEAIASRAADESLWHGDLEFAADYAWAAGERDRFAALVEQAALPLFHTGQRAVLERWLARFDDALLERHPAATLCGAFVHNVHGRPDQAAEWALIAERLSHEVPMPDGSRSAEPWLATLRAAMCRDGVDAMRRDAAAALAGLDETSPWRPSALMLLGVGQLLAGDAAAADEILAEAHAAAAVTESDNTAAIAFAERSLLAAAEGQWEHARVLAAAAREVVQEGRLETYPTSPLTFVAGARSAVRHNDWIRARDDLERARTQLPPLAPGWFAVQVHLESARVHLALAEREQAAAALARAEDVLARSGDLGVLASQAAELGRELERPAAPNGSAHHLTPAELRLLPLLTTHLTFREIGELLHISRNTVKTQAICTYRKLGVTSRSQAIDRAIELGLVARPDALDVGADRR
jgi:LuxR family transcriptional regulator, maltose regulon positive regulatory protein